MWTKPIVAFFSLTGQVSERERSESAGRKTADGSFIDMKFGKGAQQTISIGTSNSKTFLERKHRIHSFLIFDDRKMISYAPDFSIVSQKKSTKKF